MPDLKFQKNVLINWNISWIVKIMNNHTPNILLCRKCPKLYIYGGITTDENTFATYVCCTTKPADRNIGELNNGCFTHNNNFIIPEDCNYLLEHTLESEMNPK